eukprot:3108849-Pyramimonas_sp.AAC.1
MRQIPVVIENPLTSMAWQVPEMKRLMAHRSCKIAVVDQCMFNTPWKKPTTIVGWSVSEPPAPLVQRCRG